MEYDYEKKNYSSKVTIQDGLGSQLLVFITGYAIAYKNNYNYIQNSNTIHKKDIEKYGFYVNNDAQVDISERNPKLKYFGKEDELFTNEVMDNLRAILSIKINEEYDWVIHIRRRDVSRTQHKERYIKDETYEKLVKQIREKYGNEQKILICSEGVQKNFNYLNKYNVKLYLNEDIHDTMGCMIGAKNLVIGKSDYSYIAGLYNTKNVYYFPFWHKGMEHWMNVKEQFDVGYVRS
jgi:hypothetical protein